MKARSAAEERLRSLPWDALRGLAPALDAPLAEVLAGAPADRVLSRVLRARGDLPAEGRTAVAEAVLGVGLWRRRLAAQLGREGAPPRLLLATLLRDLASRTDAAAIAGLPEDALPPRRPPPTGLADRYSLPGWLEEELRRAAGDEAAALADALDLPGPVFLRVNELRIAPGALSERLLAEGVSTRPGRLARSCLVVTSRRPNVYGLPSHGEGLFEVQDEGSQLLGEAVGARPGETVLDACAGAGGKTLLLAVRVSPEGTVHATDPDPQRLERLALRARRAGASGLVVVQGPEAPAGLLADRVLVDAPCSELGALRRGPDLRWRVDPGGFARLPERQLAILSRAAGNVRPGGTLVYATCTFRREEDEEVACAFEEGHPGFARVPPAAPPSVLTPEGFLRTWPHRHGTDGFFAAAWRRSLPSRLG